ncbi:MAG: glycosyltransferase [Ignavibacteria bacterium]|nr:glycosyltransferase [Ignavibacteria bacterium]
MLTFSIIAAGTYLVLYVTLYAGFKVSEKLKHNNDYLPTVSVIVAARNEEENIAGCLESLKNLSYPTELLEVIIVNDSSSDKTKEFVLENIREHKNFTLTDSSENISKIFPGKANAVDCGIKISRGEIIMTTDADCRIPENWIQETVKYYDEKIGMVCGFTRISEDNGFSAKVQAFDWLYLLSIAIGSSGFNRTLSCIGNNLSFRKKVYDEIGGYGKIKYSVTEDLALMIAIRNSGYKIRYPVNPLSVVVTDKCKTFFELYSQKKRWFRGGTDIGFFGYFVGVLMYTVNAIMMTGFVYLPLNLYIGFFLSKFICDILIILPAYKKLHYRGLYKYFFIFEIYFMIYGILLPFTFLTGYKVKWKNRKV